MVNANDAVSVNTEGSTSNVVVNEIRLMVHTTRMIGTAQRPWQCTLLGRYLPNGVYAKP